MTRLFANNGFTLIELLLSVMISALFLALAIPVFDRAMANYELRLAARQLVSDIRSLQGLSRDLRQEGMEKEMTSYNISFDRLNECYTLRRNNENINTVSLPDTVDLYTTNFHQHMVTIRLNGTINPGGTVTLRSKGTNRTVYVVVASITGRVRVAEDYPQGGVD